MLFNKSLFFSSILFSRHFLNCLNIEDILIFPGPSLSILTAKDTDCVVLDGALLRRLFLGVEYDVFMLKSEILRSVNNKIFLSKKLIFIISLFYILK